ncbi:MAG: hypothetical protein HYY16_00025 [Planctomycetes bacterium]|nr:hypothetical protein [Planctomycetota bacterium]
MRLWLALALTAAIAGCGPPRYVEPSPEPVEPLPRPPEIVLRVPPEFRFVDYPTGKEFLFRRYTARTPTDTVDEAFLSGSRTDITEVRERGEIRLEVVTVIDPAGGGERVATETERAYALGILQEEWVQRGRGELLAYHRDVAERERRMRADLLDERIHYLERAIADSGEERFALQADLESSRETSGYAAPEGHLEWLEREIARHDASLEEMTAACEMLKYERRLRNGRMLRSSASFVVREWLPVEDLVAEGSSAEDLVAEVKANVERGSWERPEVSVRYSCGHLEVAHIRAVVERVRDYLDGRRAGARK